MTQNSVSRITVGITSPPTPRNRNFSRLSMLSTRKPKFWPKKPVTTVQTMKIVPPTVSRVATALSRSALALKYVCVSENRSSAWRPNSLVICVRWSPMSRR